MAEADNVGRIFTCTICLGEAERDPVVTACGHLFCWPCLRSWLHTAPSDCRKGCPACRRAQLLPLVAVACKLEMPDFSCSRCLKPHALQPVLLHDCGHVYCWPCLHPLLHTSSPCYVCCVPRCSFAAVRAVPLFIGANEAAAAAPTLPSRNILLSASMPVFRGPRSGILVAAIGDSCVASARLRDCFLHYCAPQYPQTERASQQRPSPVHQDEISAKQGV